MKQLTSRTVIILLSLSILFGCAYYNILFNAKKSYNEGVKEMLKSPDHTKLPASARNYFEQTVDKCWKLIDLFSENSKYADDALLYICKSEYYLEKYPLSKEHLEQFIKKYPNSKYIPEANLWYGKVLMRMDETEKADESLRAAINTSDDSKIKAEAYFELGSYEFGNNEYENAIDYYQKALNEDPDDQYQAMLQFNLGEAYYIQKNYENAIKFFKKVEKYDPSLDTEYHTKLHLAHSYSQIGKYGDAYKILRKMLTAPRFKDFVPVIKTAIGENYEKQGLYLDAMDIYRETILEKKPSPGTAQAAFNTARLYENVYKNIDSAVVYYGKVGKLFRSFDSLETAQNKEVFLRELKDIRDEIKKDKRLIYKLENDEYFKDSLYTAQYNDSLRKAMGIAKVDTQKSKEPVNPLFPAFGDTVQTVNTDSVQVDTTITNDTTEVASTNEIPSLEETLSFRNLENQKEENIKDDEIKEPEIPSQNAPEQELELRKLPQIKKDLMTNQFQLAEYYLLKVENFDSAAVYYKKFLTLYEDTLLTPKALYSLRFVYHQSGYQDSIKADSLESIILNKYPESVFAQQILKQRGLLADEEDSEKEIEKKARKLFLEAESLYFADRLEEALQKYEQVSEMDSTAEWGAKAMYAKAWIYEKKLDEKELALNSFERIIKDYPEAKDYLKVAKAKTTMPKEAAETLPEDTTTSEELAMAEGDTLQSGESIIPENIQGNGHNISSQTIERDKIRWRMRRYRK